MGKDQGLDGPEDGRCAVPDSGGVLIYKFSRVSANCIFPRHTTALELWMEDVGEKRTC